MPGAMRKLLPFLVLALLTGCSSGGSDATTTTTTAPTNADLAPELAAVLDSVVEPGAVAFDATYSVFRKLGGVSSTVEVHADPPGWSITAGDLVIRSDHHTRAQEAQLADRGVFLAFFATGPARIVAADARRSSAGAPVLSDRTVAGVAARCAGVPINGTVATTACFTAEGVAAWFDSTAVHYELTSYRAR